MKTVTIALYFLGAASTAAQPNAEGWPTFVAGDYKKAHNQGHNENTAEGLALACRSSLVTGGYLETDSASADALHEAIKDCAAALALQPDHFNAKLSLAIAVGYEGKRLRKPQFPKLSRALLEELVKAHPDNSTAIAALAAWHSEISAAGWLARLYFRTSREKARALFDNAFAKGPLEFALKMEYAKFLARGKKAERKEALALLTALERSDTVLAQDALLKAKCSPLREALELGKKRAIKTSLKQCSAFNDPDKEKGAFPIETLPHPKSIVVAD
jgi:hypothetical protein